MSVIFKDSGTFRDYFLWLKPKTEGKHQVYCSERPVFYRQLFAKALAGSSPKATPISPAKLPGPTPISIFGATITLFRDRKAQPALLHTHCCPQTTCHTLQHGHGIPLQTDILLTILFFLFQSCHYASQPSISRSRCPLQPEFSVPVAPMADDCNIPQHTMDVDAGWPGYPYPAL